MQQRSGNVSAPEAHRRAEHVIGSAVVNQDHDRNTVQNNPDSEAAGLDLALGIVFELSEWIPNGAFPDNFVAWIFRLSEPMTVNKS